MKIKNIFDFIISMVRSILHNVQSYITWEILTLRYKILSVYGDPHKYFASIIFKKAESRVTKADRSQAKVILFNSIYGKNKP
jgi:hypothetical protein